MIKIYTSSVIDAPADAVWQRIRDFNGMPGWHPLIADSRIEQNLPSDRIGCVRRVKLADGSELREQLLAGGQGQSDQAPAVELKQIENIKADRRFAAFHLQSLEQLERRTAFLIKRDHFTIKHTFVCG